MVIAVVPVLAFFTLGAMMPILTILVFLVMLILVPYSIYTIYMVPLNISYDAAFVFIASRKTEKIIALKSITQIQPVINYGSLRKRWRISYVDNSLEEDIFFYPVEGSVSLALFMKAVRTQNPSVDC